MFEVNCVASLQCHLSLPLLLVAVALRWKLEASSAPLKLIKQLSFSTNFRSIFVHVRVRACVDHGRRVAVSHTPEKENAPFPSVRKFPAGKTENSALFQTSNPRVQNFPPTRRDDFADVINSGLMITQSCFCMK